MKENNTKPYTMKREANDEKNAFEVIGLARTFRIEDHNVEVFRDVSMSVRAGEWVSITGPSGCGKSTFLYLLAALDVPTAGDVVCDGKAYSRLFSWQKTKLRRKRIGLVFQDYHLFPELNAWENVQLPALRWGENRRRVREKAAELLRTFGMAERLRHRPHEMSGGEQQRVAMARALINDPDIILADEPTGNLDPETGARIVDVLRRLQQERGDTVVMVTHNRDLAAEADRMFQLHNGALYENAHPAM